VLKSLDRTMTRAGGGVQLCNCNEMC